MTLLIIARHGNTFGPNDTPTRVGARTDLPLVESGQEQAKKIGLWLKENNFIPEVTYSSQLKRTIETAEIALKEINYAQPVFPLDIFNEIDYGVDENQTEDKVIARISEQAIKEWDEKATVPEGWKFNPQECIDNWKNFADHIVKEQNTYNTSLQKQGSLSITKEVPHQVRDVVLVVTSNGIARFAPHLAGNFEEFSNNNKIKLSTGAIGVLEFDGINDDGQWAVKDWNIRP